ncbi:MAG: lysylphosphatidylglycerol synthase transmembrane domain-containing protein [Dokdonella sp.]|uniref:lysylphosphatidylglycerol synthase transmembrane domain-containing protein n=1 Tax=Dokdonella sp. TaxID=2291710 RepID=UPI0031C7A25B|nr:flippase-like domain-containing protein [Xanthomonadales bacterium]
MTRSTLRFLQIGTGIVISVACIAYIVVRVDLSAVLNAASHLDWRYLLLGLLALCIDYSLRTVRWTLMLATAGERVLLRSSAPAFLGSMALNNVLPFRAGDFIRALVFPAAIGVTRTTATASLVLERLIDLLILLLLLALGLSLSSGIQVPTWQRDAIFLVSVAGAGVLLCLLLLGRRVGTVFEAVSNYMRTRGSLRWAGIADRLATFSHRLMDMARPRVLAVTLALTMVIWIAEAGVYLSLFHGMDIASTPFIALTTMALATLATLLPSSPGYVGPFHLAAFSAVVAAGGTPTQAAAFALLVHLSLWIPVTLAGTLCIAFNPMFFRRNITMDHDHE